MVNREGQLLNTIGFFFRCLNADRTQFTQLTAISSSDAQAGNAQATCSTHGVDDVSRIAGGAQSNQQTLSALSIGVNLLGKDQVGSYVVCKCGAQGALADKRNGGKRLLQLIGKLRYTLVFKAFLLCGWKGPA